MKKLSFITILLICCLANAQQGINYKAIINDANGIIIINIGEGTVISDVFNDIDWASAPHYLKTEIDNCDGLTDMRNNF